MRANWIRRNKYYYESLKRLLRHLVEPGKRVLNIRCQTGFLLDALQAKLMAWAWKSAPRWSK